MAINLRGKGVSFSKPEKVAEKKHTAYVGRAQNEQKRYALATDDRFWVCVCFASAEDKSALSSHFGLEEARFIPGDIFRDATSEAKPKSVKKVFPRRPKSSEKTPDPLGQVAYTGELGQDCIAEADALLAAFRTVKRPEPCKESTDSDIWFTVVFKSYEDADSYLNGWGLKKYGDKYIDGTAWLHSLV
jgi:hypothetical protein